MIRRNIWLLFFILIFVIFSAPFLKNGKVPIPVDTLVGLYHPWRDSVADQYPNGIPVKNFLITDPIRQQYPYREMVINSLKQGILPKWNPYSFSGTPLLANIQSAVFYPLNILFWLTNFTTAWSILVLLQPLLAGIFMYLYLNEMRLDKRASLMGALAFSFSGFMVAWMEWNTIGHVAIWLPAILFLKEKLLKEIRWYWIFPYLFVETSLWLAGHLQTAMYVIIFATVYLFVRMLQRSHYDIKKAIHSNLVFFIDAFLVLIVVAYQALASINFILLSARNFDLPDWHRVDWFIPWQHLLQFVSPDFFGNPATGNYWGVWNYGEFVGYIGLIPVFFALYCLISRRDKKTLFFGAGLVSALVLGLPTFVAAVPYQLNIPFLSTLQPSRIMVIIDFSLAVLAAFGFDYFLKKIPHLKLSLKEPMVRLLEILVLLFVSIWLILIFGRSLGLSGNFLNYLEVAKRNMVLPTIILSSLVLYVFLNLWKRNSKLLSVTTFLLLLFISYDLVRFSSKFNTFSDRSLLFPQTKTIDFLQKNLGAYRFMTTSREIFPPNVSTHYNIADVAGYDPLYLLNYGQLVAAWERNRPDISPTAFNRILTPQDQTSFITNLMGVKYIVSLGPIANTDNPLVFQEGETYVYQNTHVFPRAFLVSDTVSETDNKAIIEKMFSIGIDLSHVAVTDGSVFVKQAPIGKSETVEITKYTPNEVEIKVVTNQERLLVLTDPYYLDWQVSVNGRPTSIFPVDLTLRGVVVPKGESRVEFKI